MPNTVISWMIIMVSAERWTGLSLWVQIVIQTYSYHISAAYTTCVVKDSVLNKSESIDFQCGQVLSRIKNQ